MYWKITQLTNNSTDDYNPSISGTNVVWSGWDGSDYEIFSNFAGQLSNNNTIVSYISISGTNVVWQGWDGHDTEIYLAKYVVPTPSAILLATLGLDVAGWKLRKRKGL